MFCTVASIKARWTFVRTFVLFGPGWKIVISKQISEGLDELQATYFLILTVWKTHQQ